MKKHTLLIIISVLILSVSFSACAYQKIRGKAEVETYPSDERMILTPNPNLYTEDGKDEIDRIFEAPVLDSRIDSVKVVA